MTERAATTTPGPATAEGGGLAEAGRLPWRGRVTEARLRRDERGWALWTFGLLLTFGPPSVLLLWLSPWTFPAALLWSGHGVAIFLMQARKGARSAVAIGSERSAAHREGVDEGPETAALGLLGDLLDHRERELLQRTGLALQRGRLGVWLVGESGALLARPGGRRIHAWCVRVAEAEDLPAGDRVAHLLLALREDEEGFATVANLGFCGAAWRVQAWMPRRERPALEEARAAARLLVGASARPLSPEAA